MFKKKLDVLIPLAYDVLATNEQDKGNLNSIFNEDGAIPNTFKSYISSFGASVIQSGLNAALTFNSNGTETGKQRKKVMNLLLEILKKSNKIPENTSSLLEYSKTNNSAMLKKNIMDAAVALKLAMRTFKFEK